MLKVILLVGLLSSAGFSKTWTFDKSKHNSVVFTGTAIPGFLRLESKGGFVQGEVKGSLDSFYADLRVDVSKMEVWPALRNSHMHTKYMETDKWPLATLIIKNGGPITLGKDFEWKGDLTIKGKAKLASGKANFDGKRLRAWFSLSIDDFPIGVPKFAGVVMSRDVAVEVDAVVE